MTLFTELKRRNVFRVGAAYVVTAWLLIQVAETIFPLFGFGDTPARIVVVVLAIGFIPAVIISWVYELTSEGLKKEKDIDRNKVFARSAGRRFDFAVIGLLAIALSVVGINWFTERDMRWARDDAFPSIEAHTDAGEWEAAYALARQVEERLPNDPTMAELWPTLSWTTTIPSDPSGAKVFRRPYAATDNTWEELGVTPLTEIRFPFGLSVLRFELDGYAPILRLHGQSMSSWPKLPFRYPPRIINDPLLQEMVHVNGRSEDLDDGLIGLGDFFIGRYEVTNAEFQHFVSANGYEDKKYWQELIADSDAVSWNDAMVQFTDLTGQRGPSTWVAGTYPDGKENYPVAGVSWYEAAAYARFRQMELPTYHHWHHAFGWANHLGWLLPMSNLRGDGPAPGGTFRGITWPGAFDMAGNVREWCLNSGTDNERVILGAGWEDQDYAVWESVLDANSVSPMNRHGTNGIRLAVTRDNEEARRRAADPVPASTPEVFVIGAPLSDDLFAAYRRDYDYDKAPLNASVELTEAGSHWTRERVSFDAAYGNDRVILELFLPLNSSPPYQTIIHFPGAGGENRTSRPSGWGPLRLDYAPKNGRAVAIPIYQGTFDRQLPDIPLRGTIASRDRVIQQIKDLRRTIDYLESRHDIDKDKLAYQGYSLGGRLGGIVLAVEPRLKVGILEQAGFESGIHSDIDVIKFLPRVEVPVLQINGRYDGDFRYETDALPFFELIGTHEEDKRHFVAPLGHSADNRTVVRESLTWLEKYLGPP